MTTLRERLDEALPCTENPLLPCRQVFADRERWCANCRARALIESWAYGEERECECRDGFEVFKTEEGRGIRQHATCHGTGKTREPGLPERVRQEAAGQAMTADCSVTPAMVVASLRQELGEVT